MAPTRTFDGWLKQIRSEDLSQHERQALDLLFPSLVPPDAASVDAATRAFLQANQEHASEEIIARMLPSVRVNRRRYAGDHTLGPRNYHTVAINAAGEDGGTLLAELSAYAQADVGDCVLHDNAAPDTAKRLGLEFRERCLLLELRGTPGSNAALARLGTRALYLPYRVERTRIEGVIDLRHPQQQEWFCAEFGDFHRHTRQVLESMKKTPDAVLPDFRATARPRSFHFMLPVLMDPQRGGNVVTDHIGQWMRLHGVSALVFPSARTVVGVACEGEEVRSWTGWNLVDYRGRDPQVFSATTLLLGSDPWHSPYADRFKFEQRDAVWVMTPPKTTFGSRWPVSDGDLQARFFAAEPVFGGLLPLALQHQQDTEDGWLESMRAACDTDAGRRILGYMDIRAVRTIEAADGRVTALLLECWRHDDESERISKGFACVPPYGVQVHRSLDELGSASTLVPGQPAYAEIADGMHLYLLKEAGTLVSFED